LIGFQTPVLNGMSVLEVLEWRRGDWKILASTHAPPELSEPAITSTRPFAIVISIMRDRNFNG
jgi:hypothetical protein